MYDNIPQHKGEMRENVGPSGRDWIESTMASGMPISWMPMSDGWKSISGTAKRSLASLRICSPVLYFPLKTISSLGWWTERERRTQRRVVVQPQFKCVVSPCRSLFWCRWSLEEHNPSSQCFPPPSTWQKTSFSNTLDLFYLIISLSFFLKEDLSKFWTFDLVQSGKMS